MGIFKGLAQEGRRGYRDPHAHLSPAAAYAARVNERETRVIDALAAAPEKVERFGRTEIRGDYQDAHVLHRLVLENGGVVAKEGLDVSQTEPRVWKIEGLLIERRGSGADTIGFEITKEEEE